MGLLLQRIANLAQQGDVFRRRGRLGRRGGFFTLQPVHLLDHEEDDEGEDDEVEQDGDEAAIGEDGAGFLGFDQRGRGLA